MTASSGGGNWYLNVRDRLHCCGLSWVRGNASRNAAEFGPTPADSDKQQTLSTSILAHRIRTKLPTNNGQGRERCAFSLRLVCVQKTGTHSCTKS